MWNKAYLFKNNDMNFGTIKDIFASQLVESQLSDDKGGKKLYKKFIKTITENEVLKSQFIVYKNIENKHFDSEVTASDYLKENVSVLKRFKKEDIDKANNQLVNLLENSGIESSPDTYRQLHSCLHTLITEEKSASNINKMHESFETVKDWLLVDKSVEEKSDYVKEGVDPKKFLDLVVGKYNDKYSELTEDEKRVIKVLREGDESSMKSLVTDLIKENIDLINEHLENYNGNIEMKTRLLETKDTIYRMVENDDSSSERVLKLFELKNNLSHDS